MFAQELAVGLSWISRRLKNIGLMSAYPELAWYYLYKINMQSPNRKPQSANCSATHGHEFHYFRTEIHMA
jgi:hypothetical protein